MNLSLSFIRGIVASVNPCGFVLLPTYLMYFLGISAADDRNTAPIRRALLVGLSVSAGFMTVFVAIGAVSEFFTDWLLANAKYATAAIGVGFVVLGAAMLLGYRLPIHVPQLQVGQTRRTMWSMLVYGVAYATASLGCTLPLFIGVLFASSRRAGYGAGVANAAAYALGMAAVVITLTVTLAVANTGLIRLLRSGMQYVEMIAGAFVLLSGLYLLWYFYWLDIREEGDPITDAVARLGNRIESAFYNNWKSVLAVVIVVIGAAMLYSAIRERSSKLEMSSPDD